MSESPNTIELKFPVGTPYAEVDDALSMWIKNGYQIANFGLNDDQTIILYTMKLFRDGECKSCDKKD